LSNDFRGSDQSRRKTGRFWPNTVPIHPATPGGLRFGCRPDLREGSELKIGMFELRPQSNLPMPDRCEDNTYARHVRFGTITITVTEENAPLTIDASRT